MASTYQTVYFDLKGPEKVAFEALKAKGLPVPEFKDYVRNATIQALKLDSVAAGVVLS